MGVPGESESELVRRAKEGRREAWDRLFQQYQAPLFAYLNQLVRNEETALDLLQETFLAALRWIGSLKGEGKFGGWIYRIAHQKAVQVWRRSGRETNWGDSEWPEMAEETPTPREVLIAEEKSAQLFDLLEVLPGGQRSVLLLHYLEDISLEEIARITDSELGTVKSRLHYARKALRQLWEQENEKNHS